MLLLALLQSRTLVHTVVRGDTLSSIGRRYDVTVSQILAVNPTITNVARIEIGQEIAIPRIHTVVRGDTLLGIGRKYSVTVAAILAVNPTITSASQIKIGQKITIPMR